MTDLNIRPKIIKYIEDDIGTKFMDLSLTGVSVNLTSMAREIK